ncbi:MAG: choice-of-anchor L domain-containing protein, partial [Phaeodactylibacter sp.]|nr:choice-of-anchor L domain-containing protein [Phaeodactylibacter sp.]
MRSRLLAMLVFLPVLFGFSDLDHRTKKALKDPQIVQLEGTTSRFIVDLDGADTEGIQLCGLEIGETYEIIVAQSQQCKPSFKVPGLPLTSGEVVSIVADAECVTLYAYSESVKVCPEPVYLSVHCASCPPKALDTPEGGGPITTSIGFTDAALVQDVFIGGGCFEISNVSYSGSPVARGRFQGAMSSIGISEGVILSSGAIAGAIGPNDESGAGSTTGGGSDSDLSQVANGTSINDKAVLEFDFTPTIPQISFRYVFASEEYCEYVNSNFNDAFGFFLSGPGINGPFSNNAINIATLPDGTNVSINNVNHLTNAGFYVPNIPEGEPNCAGHPLAVGPATAYCQFDGFTTVLTAVANVIPCETYHIKLAVGDGTDSVFDSAVFLEANSFEAGGTAEVVADVPLTASNITYETCGNGFFTFTRNGGDISQPMVINFTVGGTATPGVDYQTLPTSVTIPPFVPFIQLPVSVIQDLIAEGSENIILTLDEPCVCTASTAELIIQEVPELNVAIDDQSTCFGLPITINPTV